MKSEVLLAAPPAQPPARRARILALTGAALALATALLHLLAGQRDVVDPLLRADLAAVPRWTQLAVWHMVTVDLFAAALVLAWSSRAGARAAPALLAQGPRFIAYGLVFLGAALSAPIPGALLALPQWILLLPIGGLSLLSARQPR